ncbi:MAG: nitrite reductase (NAD(P)H) small subunit [Robiginitomaculum sp.]|nr:MAG: nitrite reductase (NAD(P)H) small subunit [Robiginitomaculum sp.]
MSDWYEVCGLNDIPLRGSRIVKTERGCVALFRTADNDVFALDDKCPHKQGPLSQGIVHDRSVTCPLHGWVFSLETGEAQGADTGKVRTMPVRVVDGSVHIQLEKTFA